MAGWKLPAAFNELRDVLRSEARKPDQEWVRVLRLLEQHSMEAVEAAVRSALDAGSAHLHTIRMLLRPESTQQQDLDPIELEREDLMNCDVAPARLSDWDSLLEGGAQ